MNLSSSKYGPKLGHPKIAHHSNLSPSLDSKVANWSRIVKMVVFFVAGTCDSNSEKDFRSVPIKMFDPSYFVKFECWWYFF